MPALGLCRTLCDWYRARTDRLHHAHDEHDDLPLDTPTPRNRGSLPRGANDESGLLARARAAGCEGCSIGRWQPRADQGGLEGRLLGPQRVTGEVSVLTSLR